MRHVTNGALTLAFHTRPERFEDGRGRDTGLRPLDLDAPRLGVGTAEDLDWTQRLNLDACVQGGCRDRHALVARSSTSRASPPAAT